MTKNIDEKIDKLARVVKTGFDHVDEQFAEMRGDMTTLRNEMRRDMTTLRNEMRGDMTILRNDIDIMLSRHIGTFRKDYDELAARVKRLEERLLS